MTRTLDRSDDRPAKAKAAPGTSVKAMGSSLGSLAASAETTRMATVFTDATAADNPVIFANDAFLNLTGFAREGLLGQPIMTVLGKITDSGSLASVQKALAAGHDDAWELPCLRADRNDCLASIFLSPLRDEQGVVRRNSLTLIELSGPIDRLLAQQNEFHALYENAPGFIATLEGPEHRFTFTNAAYRKFVGRDVQVGQTVKEALPEMVEQGIIDVLDRVYQTGTAFVGNSMALGLTNQQTGEVETRYIDVVYQPVLDASGTVTGLFCEGYDVTAQYAAREELAALRSELIYVSRMNAMGTMAATLAHELNQPLSAIVNYTAGIRRLNPAAQEPSALNSGLLGIEDAAHRAVDIIRNLRELTRRREPARAAFDLKSAVDGCIRLVSASFLPGVHFANQIPDNTMMTADQVQIQQVVVNLLVNAYDAVETVEHRKITIAVVCGEETMTVSVADTGPGVPAGAADNIFAWSGSSKADGMGLGLSICRTIVEDHGGRIWLNKSGDTGSEFCFALPQPSIL